MKIAQITPVYPPRIGGIGNVAQEYVLSLLRNGDNVTVFTPKYGSELNNNTVDYLKPLYKWGNAALIPQLIWKLKDFDILHLHYPFYGGAESVAIASFIWHKPLIITYHMRPVSSGWQEWIFRIYGFLIEPIIFLASKIICVSSIDYAKSVRLRSDKFIELPFSVDDKIYHPSEDKSVREKYKISKTSKLIIFVGGLDDAHYFKGLDVLLKSCASLGDDIDWRLLIVGEGNRRKEFEEMAQKMKINNRVYFAGRVDNQDLPKYYQASDIHVLPAINGCEAFGLVTLEAAASGIPSIVSDLPGVRTLINNGKTGLIVKPSDSADLLLALKFLIEKNKLRVNMGNNARSMTEQKYSKYVIFDRLISIYKSIL
jgi:glycosyltransferase involved in cell wall biosynthesis